MPLTLFFFVFLFVVHILAVSHLDCDTFHTHTRTNNGGGKRKKKISILLPTLNAGAELLLLSARWSKRHLKWRGFLCSIQISLRLIVLFRERFRKGWMWRSFCCYSFTSRMYSSKIFMHWVTSTSFVLSLLCWDDVCSAQFPHPQQNTVLYIGD